MSRIENGKMEIECIATDICRIFYDIYDLFEEQMKQKQMDFQINTSGIKNRFVFCDEKNLNRIILNLLSNAYKFTSVGGKINVSVSEKNNEEEGFSSYEISVCDNGIGMSEEFAEKMFSPFERERTSTVSGIEGTGLGLSITKSLVDLMGGNIDVITSPGNGTKIILNLKLKIADETDIVHQDNNERPQDAEMLFTDKRLLLVEDNMINMEISNMILSQAGFIVDIAENGKIAVEKISASEAGYYSVVLMDVQMPVMDGYTATRMIRELDNKELAGIPIIAMTANAFKEDEDAALKAGMQAHITKPIDVDILLQTLKSILSKGQ
jgi:CheY-like chemotaxis protein